MNLDWDTSMGLSCCRFFFCTTNTRSISHEWLTTRMVKEKLFHGKRVQKTRSTYRDSNRGTLEYKAVTLRRSPNKSGRWKYMRSRWVTRGSLTAIYLTLRGETERCDGFFIDGDCWTVCGVVDVVGRRQVWVLWYSLTVAVALRLHHYSLLYHTVAHAPVCSSLARFHLDPLTTSSLHGHACRRSTA